MDQTTRKHLTRHEHTCGSAQAVDNAEVASGPLTRGSRLSGGTRCAQHSGTTAGSRYAATGSRAGWSANSPGSCIATEPLDAARAGTRRSCGAVAAVAAVAAIPAVASGPAATTVASRTRRGAATGSADPAAAGRPAVAAIATIG